MPADKNVSVPIGEDKFQLEKNPSHAHLRAPLAEKKRQNFEKLRENNTNFSTSGSAMLEDTTPPQ